MEYVEHEDYKPTQATVEYFADIERYVRNAETSEDLNFYIQEMSDISSKVSLMRKLIPNELPGEIMDSLYYYYTYCESEADKLYKLAVDIQEELTEAEKEYREYGSWTDQERRAYYGSVL